MSSEYDLDDIEDQDESNEPPPGSNAAKVLRQELKAEKKARADLEAKLSELEKGQRTATVKEWVRSRDLPEKAAGLYSGEATEEAFNKWLDEYGELIGHKPSDKETASDEETVKSAEQMQQTASTSRTDDPSASDLVSFKAELDAAKTREALDAVYAKRGMLPPQ